MRCPPGPPSLLPTLLLLLIVNSTNSSTKVKRQLSFSFGGGNNGRQDLLGNVIGGLFGQQPNNNAQTSPNPNSQTGNNGIVINPLDIFNSFAGRPGNNNRPAPNNNNQNRPNAGKNDTHLATVNLGNVPIHVTGNQNGGIGLNFGGRPHRPPQRPHRPIQNQCGPSNGNCEQVCQIRRRRFRCSCFPGYHLNRDRRTCFDIDECRGTNGGCQGGCTNTPGSFTCSCPAPQQLQADGRSCANSGSTSGIPSCNINNGGCSQGCSQGSAGVTCFCQQGYLLGQDQKSCQQQVDKCTLNNGGCQHICSTTQLGVQCSCRQGFVLQSDKVSCAPSSTTTCAFNNGGCQHFCRDFSGGRKCFCGRGYHLQPDGVSCSTTQFVQVCSQNNGGCQHLCNQNIFGIQCGCNLGFKLSQDRVSCEDVNECSFRNGGCQQTCLNTDGSRTCSCQSGTLQADGVTCSSVASTATCSKQNGGCAHNCAIVSNQVKCTCQTGFTLAANGKSCSDINECNSNNGGCEHQCFNNNGSFRCQCNDGFVISQGKCVGVNQTPRPKNGCGVNSKKSLFNRIVGGKPADPKDWPWMAALLKRTGDVQYCGGSLITDRHILTAAHCLKPFSASEIKVRLGEYDFDTFNDNNPTDFNVVDVRLHENYNTRTQENDIAIIKLDRSTEFSEFIWPVCLPDPAADYEGRIGYVIGWGTIYFGGPVSATLQEIVIPVWSQSDCNAAYPGKVNETMMCAGLKEGKKDSCQGDSGGPFQIQDRGTLRWQLAGLVSWGIQCANPNNPGVYTRVNRYIDWIKRNAIF